MPPDVLAPFILSIAVTAGVAAVLILRGPVGRAFARRIEGTAAPAPELATRIAELEQRLAQVEDDRGRMAELEERLDFAERVLAAGKEPRELPR